MEHDISLSEFCVTILVAIVICIPFGIGIYFMDKSVDNSGLTHRQSVYITEIAKHPEMQPIIKEANEDYINLEEYREITDKYDKLIIEKSIE